MLIAARFVLFTVALLAAAHTFAVDLNIARMPAPASSTPSQILLYDVGFASPFVIRAALYKELKMCPVDGKAILGILVSDFGEGPTKAFYCVSGISQVHRLHLSIAEDSASEVGRAAVLEVAHVGPNGQETAFFRIIPWAASRENAQTDRR